MTAEQFLTPKTGVWENTFAHLKEGAGAWFFLSFLENLQCFPESAGQSDQSGHCTESFSWLLTVGLKVFALNFISFYPFPYSAVENSFNLMKILQKMKNVSMRLTVYCLLVELFLILLCYTGRHRQKVQLFQDWLLLWMFLCDVTASGSDIISHARLLEEWKIKVLKLLIREISKVQCGHPSDVLFVVAHSGIAEVFILTFCLYLTYLHVTNDSFKALFAYISAAVETKS